MAKSIKVLNVTLSSSERKKRLQPYANFYLSLNQRSNGYQIEHPMSFNYRNFGNNYADNQHRSKQTLTPFLRSNAVPGPFRPIKIDAKEIPSNGYVRITDSNPNEFSIFPLKLSQNNIPISTNLSQLSNYYFVQDNIQTNIPVKTAIETFTVRNIEIPTETVEPHQVYSRTNYKIHPNPVVFIPQVTTTIGQNAVIHKYKPVTVSYPNAGSNNILTSQENKIPVQIHHDRKPLIIQPNPVKLLPTINYDAKHETVYYGDIMKIPEKYNVNYEVNSDHLSQKLKKNKMEEVIRKYENDPTLSFNREKLKNQHYSKSQIKPHQNAINLVQILKQLQATNTLPTTITPNDIDNSIETLVKILIKLKKQQNFSKPIVVPENSYEQTEYEDKISDKEKDGAERLENEDENYPADTPEGGTPGTAGVDYPALYSIPQTSFSCKTQRYKGFFGDPDTNCQVITYFTLIYKISNLI